MILARVWYELFEWEAKWLNNHPDYEYLELNRQLRLEMVDGATVYVTWNGGSDFYVDFREASFCFGNAEVEQEASASRLWSNLIGRQLDFSYRGEERQILEIRSGNSATYCCSFKRGDWGRDVLHIALRLPT